MNKRVLQTTLGLILCTILAMYIGQIFAPQTFAVVVENPRLLALGSYIDTHKWAYYPATFGFCFLTYWLFVCAACCKKFLNRREVWETVAVIMASYLLSGIAPEMATGVHIMGMMALCVSFGANMRDYALVFIVHTVGSLLLIFARGLFIYAVSANFIIGLLAHLEGYLWLLILYLLQNFYEKGDYEWETLSLRGLEKARTFLRKKFARQKPN